jgi:hypothetical protein
MSAPVWIFLILLWALIINAVVLYIKDRNRKAYHDGWKDGFNARQSRLGLKDD